MILDARIAADGGPVGRTTTFPRSSSRKRLMSVKSALEWAFGPERAQMDFDLLGAHEFDRIGVSPEWRMMQEAKLGCRVDGGGSSDPHPDAALIAAAVEALSINPVYGKAMAVIVATNARAGTSPDWRGEPNIRVAPMGWDITDDGERTGYEVYAGEWSYRRKNRTIRRGRSRVCPIQYIGGAASVSAARRRYLDWWGALLEIATTLRIPGYLGGAKISAVMPPLTPWRNNPEKRV